MKIEILSNFRNVKTKLEKIEIRDLIGKGIGALAVIATITMGAKAYNTLHIDRGFEYNNNYPRVYDEENNKLLNNSLVEQLEEYSKEKLLPEIAAIIENLSNYVVAKENYEELVSIDNPNEEEVKKARVELVKQVNNLKIYAHNILSILVMNSLNLSTNAFIDYDNYFNSADGPTYCINIEDGEKSYVINTLPYEYSKLLNTIDTLNEYNGDGTNSTAWNKEVTLSFIEESDELYYRIINMVFDKPNFKAREISKESTR